MLGKIGILQKTIWELEIRIRNQQSAIRLATAPFFSFAELEQQLPALQNAVAAYQQSLAEYQTASADLHRLQEEVAG